MPALREDVEGADGKSAGFDQPGDALTVLGNHFEVVLEDDRLSVEEMALEVTTES